MMWLVLAGLLYAALEWPMVLLLLRGFVTFCAGAVVLVLLLAALGVAWCVDTGLGRLVDWLADNAESLE